MAVARAAPITSSRMLRIGRRAFQQMKEQPVAELQQELPWYLREEVNTSADADNDIEVPDVPENSPESLAKFLNLAAKDYGLQDIQLYDLTTLDKDHPHSIENQPFDYIIIATGKSEKHVFKAGNELKHFIKHTYSTQAKVNGLVSAAPNPVTRRRMIKRANKSPPATDNDFGMSANSWVMCETSVDNICIHVLTQLRRQELNLESLWVPEDNNGEFKTNYNELYNKDTSDVPSFFLSRRQFHTSARNLNLSAIDGILSQKEITNDLAKEHIQSYESNFKGVLFSDYDSRNEFYRLLHVVSPTVVSLSQVRDVILEKYTNLELLSSVGGDMSKEKAKDVVVFMKTLLDTSEIASAFTEKEIADERYDQLSQFVAHLYRLTDDSLDLHTIPEFIPLLWRLSFIEETKGAELGSSIVNQVMSGDRQWENIEFKTFLNAENRSRDINDVIELYASSFKSIISSSVRELQLFTYGNAGNWQNFWKTWELINLLAKKQDFNTWLSLTSYLALRNSPEANSYFLKNVFKSSSTISGSLLSNYETNRDNISDSDKEILKESLLLILSSASATQTVPNGDEIKQIIDAL